MQFFGSKLLNFIQHYDRKTWNDNYAGHLKINI